VAQPRDQTRRLCIQEDLARLIRQGRCHVLNRRTRLREDRVVALNGQQRGRRALLDILRVRGLLRMEQRRWREAEDAIEHSLALACSMPFPYAEAKALHVCGQLHGAKHEPQQAREKYTRALSICDELGEGLYRPHIEQALTQLGQATP